MSAQGPEPLAPVRDRPPFPFGGWGTVAWGLAVVAAFAAVQGLVVAAYVAITLGGGPHGAGLRALELDGLLLAIATLATTAVCGGLIALAVRLARAPVRASLALVPVRAGALLPWLAATVAFMLLSDGLTALLERPVVPPFMLDVYRSAGVVPLLWLALVVAAPLFEELLFRGFLLEGLRHAPLGGAGAVIVTSLLWAAIHVQYGAYEIATISVLGVLLAVARLHTRSLFTPLAMHAANNLVAMLQTALWVRAG